MGKMYRKLLALTFFAFLFLAPLKGNCVNITYDISKLQALLQQLQDAGNNVVGNAGIEIRQSIDDVSSQVAQRIAQIQSAGVDIINQASGQLEKIMNDLMNKVQSLLAEVNNMVKGDISCINADLAQRISQISDTISDTLSQLDDILKQTIDQIYVRATQLISSGSTSIAITVNSTFIIIAKVILVIFIFILLFWLIRNLWLQKFPLNKLLKFGIPMLIIAVIGCFVYLLFSYSALPRIIGTKTDIPIGVSTCNQADSLYEGFLASYNISGEKIDAQLISLGNKAIEQLSMCQYSSTSAIEITDTEEKIAGISALLFPPPAISSVQETTSGSACAATPSVPPSLLSKFNSSKLLTLQRLKDNKQISGNNIFIADPAVYRSEVDRLTHIQTITVPVRKNIEPIKIEKLNPNVAKILTRGK